MWSFSRRLSHADREGVRTPSADSWASVARGPSEATKEGEDSAKSLPKLIRRATKIGTNLDQGETASRTGMLEMLNARDKE